MIRVGTRASRLARAQTQQVCTGLARAGHETSLHPIQTLGDGNRSMPVKELGVAGAFTAGLTRALLAEEIDLAVHSLKDLPVDQPEGLTLAAILERGPPADVLLVRDEAHEPEADPPLVEGAHAATSGPRRRSQLAAERPDLAIVDVRGNVDTRIRKLREGWFDALVTARVALERMDLDLADLHVHRLDPETYPPAPGQAAIAVQAREASPAARAARALDHAPTRRAVEAERQLLSALGGGCGLPLGAWVHRDDGSWRLHATYAGTGWDPSHEARLRRADLRTEHPSAALEEAHDQIADVRPRPRAPPLADAPRPEGDPVLVVASEPTARRWTAFLRQAGRAAEPVPTRRFTPRDHDDTPPVSKVDWIAVTSRQAAAPLARALADPLEANVAAVGPGTARALQAEGLPCHLVARPASGAGLAEHLAAIGEVGRVLLVQGDLSHGDAATRLAKAGVTVDRWQAYTTREEAIDPGQIDAALPAPAALVMSPRNAATLADADASQLARAFVAIGPSTAQALRSLGLDPTVARAPRPDPVMEMLP